MTSERKAAANRRNAKKSTGPKSRVGRLRASQNSLRHGLAAGWSQSDSWSEGHQSLANALSTGGEERVRMLARSIADIEFQIVSIRNARAFLVNKFVMDRFKPRKQPDLDDLDVGLKHPNPKVVWAVNRLLRKLRKHYDSEAQITSSEYSASISALSAFERYEDRAIQKRKRYIEAYDTCR